MVKEKLLKHLPDILVGTACIGVPTTAVLTARAAVKNERMGPMVETRDKVKNYILPAAVGITTVGCMVAARILDIQSDKAVVASLAFANKMVERYDIAISNRYGAEEAAEIHKAVVADARMTDIHKEYQDNDRIWCYEPYTETYFSATQVELLAAEIELNKEFAISQHVWLDDWLDILGITHPNREHSELLGWHYGWFVDDTFYWNSSFLGYYLAVYADSYTTDGALIIRLNEDPYMPDDPDCWVPGTDTKFDAEYSRRIQSL